MMLQYSRPGADDLQLCRAGEINLTPDQAWGEIMEAADDFVVIFMQPGYYTGGGEIVVVLDI